jgi:RHS repeat-associated protein
VRDSESGLDYFGARHYASSLGRFQTPDEPFIDQHLGEPQSWNLYAYVRNNPLIYVDPTGQGLMTAHGGQGHMLAFARPGGLDSIFGESWSNYSSFNFSEQAVGGESSETTPTSENVEEVIQEGSQANIDKRNAIAATAEKYDGSTVWAYDTAKGVFPERQNKCNQFVGDVTAEAGAQATVPGKDGKPFLQADGKARPPTAAEWANRGTSIPNWRVLAAGEPPQPGDVAAYKIGRGNTPGATGHSGIVIRDRKTGALTSISAHHRRVGPANSQFFGRTDVVFRRYTGP